MFQAAGRHGFFGSTPQRGSACLIQPMGNIRPLIPLAMAIAGFSTWKADAHDSSDAAIARLTNDLSRNPGDARLYVERAGLHLEHGDWKSCLADLDLAGRHAHSDLALDRMRGRALALGGQLKEAIRLLDCHLASHPSDASAWMERGRVHEAMGELQTAAEDRLRALDLTPRPEPDAIIGCADLLVKLGRDDEALKRLDQAPLLPVLVDRAVRIELARSRHDAALRRIDALIAVTKVPEPLLAVRASVLARAGRTADAIAGWKALSQRIGNLPPGIRSSQSMQSLASQCDQALESLQQTSGNP